MDSVVLCLIPVQAILHRGFSRGSLFILIVQLLRPANHPPMDPGKDTYALNSVDLATNVGGANAAALAIKRAAIVNFILYL